MWTEVGRIRVAWPKIAWLYGMSAAALLWIPSVDSTLAALALTVLTVCLGHSVGLHRGMIHRAFWMPRGLRFVLAELFVLTGLGGPLSWIRLHYVRDYWQNQPACPPYFAYRHSLIRDYFWNLHCEFVPVNWERYSIPEDLEKDPWLRWLEKTWPAHTLALFLALLLAGPEYAAAAVCGRIASTILGHGFIGFVSHKYGYRPYRLVGAGEEGRNTLILGWLSFGEGFHNNHHAFPQSARMGHRWFEFDLGWIVVRLLAKLRLIREVQTFGRATQRPGLLA